MASDDQFDVLVHDMCTTVTRKAFAEVEAEDRAAERLKKIGPTPEQLSVWGQWKLYFPLPCPVPATRREMMTPRWGKYLPPPKSYCDVETMSERDISLTKRWREWDPAMEDETLRKKHSERVNVWRNLLVTNKNGPFLPGVFKFKNTKSLVDIICPTKKTSLDNTFEVVDLKDIIPEIVVDFCEEMVPLEADKPVELQTRRTNNKKQKKRNFLSFFGKCIN